MTNFSDVEQEKGANQGHRLTLGGFFGRRKAPEKPPQEDMSHLPPEQQKRALKKMRKDAEKDFDKTRAELKGLEKMAKLAESGAKMGNQNFNAQITDLKKRESDIERRINQINNWLGEKSSSKPAEPGNFTFEIFDKNIFTKKSFSNFLKIF